MSKLYEIKPYSRRQAAKLNVVIRASRSGHHKIDVFDVHGRFITSIGDKRYSDYPTYISTHGKEYADKRRKLYKGRHENDRHEVGTTGYYADKILW